MPIKPNVYSVPPMTPLRLLEGVTLNGQPVAMPDRADPDPANYCKLHDMFRPCYWCGPTSAA